MQDFRISPGPQVWKQVEAALPNEKRKRWFAFWWLLPIGLLLGGTIWYASGIDKPKAIAEKHLTIQDGTGGDSLKQLQQVGRRADTAKPMLLAKAEQIDKQHPIQQVPITNEGKTSTAITTKAQPETISQSTVETNKIQKLTENTVFVKPIKIMPAKTKRKTIEPQPGFVKTAAANREHLLPAKQQTSGMPFLTIPDDDKEKNVKNDLLIKIPKAGKTVATNVYQTGTDYLNQEQKKIEKYLPTSDSTIKNVSNGSNQNMTRVEAAITATIISPALITPYNSNDSAAAVNSPAAQPTPSSTEKKNNNKNEWQFFAAVGISNTKQNLFGSSNKSLAEALQNNVGSGTGSAAFSSTAQKPTPGFSYTAGAERLQNMGKQWQWYAAFQYNFLSNHQRTGARKDSSFSTFDNSGFSNASSRNTTTVPGFYYPGSNITHTNTVHQLGLQTGLRYTLNPTAKKPLSLRGGVMANWQVATTQLLYNATKGAYYYAPTDTHHFTMGTQLGLDWKIGKGLSIGAFVQYNFTKINKVEMATYLRWQMSGVRVAIPLRGN